MIFSADEGYLMSDREWQALDQLRRAPLDSMRASRIAGVGPTTIQTLIRRGLIELDAGGSASLLEPHYSLSEKGWAAFRWRHTKGNLAK